jgi:hypothetical protein
MMIATGSTQAVALLSRSVFLEQNGIDFLSAFFIRRSSGSH